MVALKQFRNSKPSFSDLLPYAGLVADGIILLKDGSLMAGWYFAGPDSESSTNIERNEVSRQINAVLSRLGSGWMIQVEAVRVPTTAYPAREACHFPDPVTRAIDEERRAHFMAERGHYESQHALILTYRPPEPRRSAMARYVYSDKASRSETYANRVLNTFQSSIREDGFPAESFPGTLNSLDLMPLTYRWSSRFMFLDDQEAKQKLERTRKKWQQKVRPFFDQLFQTQSSSVDQDAMTMVAETEDAIAAASSQLVAYGYYTPVIVMFDTDEARLRDQAEAVRRLIQAEGFGARIETLNATEAYLGSLPGNTYANIREPLINTSNLADLIPVNSVWAGSAVAPCPFYPPNAPPLMQVASGSSPFRLNLHVDDVGHTLIFGPTGSGKSTLLALIAAQFRRYEAAQIFAFDKGKSLYPLTKAAGGDHYEIGAGEGALAFCPLAELSTDGDRAWAAEWVETLVSMQGVTITPDHRNAIARQIALMAEARGRSLSDFVSGVQMREIKTALHHYTVDGPMGQLLDAEADGLQLETFQTFEVEELMNMGERNLVPVLLYLFRRIEMRLTGNPSLIILDEAWLMLGHATFRDKIREWLKVLRKANCAVVLATQSISDAEQSGIIDVLKESCPTKICLPNGAAREPGTREFYERIGFNERQIEIVATAIPKREYYVASPEGRRLFDMTLGPVALAFVGASGRQDLKHINELSQQHGPEWPIHWLRTRGVDNAKRILSIN